MEFKDLFLRPLKNFYDNALAQISEINRKYKTPQVKTTPMVKFSLVLLRVYLFVLIAMLVYKFITLL
ncbi:MAG TPA: hypothetical protein VK469_00025 [Candidatus Kapabacteria bacterium]|nr:hypothetical protein [Candidatus Kapabacteria bacterium]